MTTVAAVQLNLSDEQDASQRRHQVRVLLADIEAELIVLPELWEIGPFAVAENRAHG
jgi:predicted amidohydrolase